ncbi:TspO/MBR family protein [Heyndrickxia acidicola]|uniref:Tryptophan-rich sensory protein n=1 Tax=Heyndrickxia acidicola TaxID=209389 RepID=A0ABU6MNN3_9BACI|nr:TspO/MBR family protein [Heyndrickxia acidicola]MED1204645.1 tryptophan-rich sensory protein [Heyndrickxia acidicola]
MLFFFNLLAYLLVIVVNGLAIYLPLNGQTTQEISNRIPVLFTPAGYVFSIWGVIYLLLAVWVFRMLLKKYRKSEIYRKTSPLFILSCILNCAWIFLWQYNYFVICVLVIIGLLVTLAAIYRRINRIGDTFWGRVPYSVYLGWVSVATIANLSYTLAYLRLLILGTPDVIWTLLMLLVGAVIAIQFRYRNQDWVYPLVFVWAYIGIFVKDLHSSAIVAYTAMVLAVIIFLAAVIGRKK